MLLTALPNKILDRTIQTDFRKWLRFGIMWDSPLLPKEKYLLSLLNILGKVPTGAEPYFIAIMDFYACGEKPKGQPAVERLIDWQVDAAAIWADFMLYGGIDLDTADLHWWQFMALLGSLPDEARIKQRISIRSIDLSRIKDPETRAEYARQKEAVALNPMDEDLDELYERLGE